MFLPVEVQVDLQRKLESTTLSLTDPDPDMTFKTSLGLGHGTVKLSGQIPRVSRCKIVDPDGGGGWLLEVFFVCLQCWQVMGFLWDFSWFFLGLSIQFWKHFLDAKRFIWISTKSESTKQYGINLGHPRVVARKFSRRWKWPSFRVRRVWIDQCKREFKQLKKSLKPKHGSLNSQQTGPIYMIPFCSSLLGSWAGEEYFTIVVGNPGKSGHLCFPRWRWKITSKVAYPKLRWN